MGLRINVYEILKLGILEMILFINKYETVMRNLIYLEVNSMRILSCMVSVAPISKMISR